MRLKGTQPSRSKPSKTYWLYKAVCNLSVCLCWRPFTGLALGTLRPVVKLPLTEMGKNQTAHTIPLSFHFWLLRWNICLLAFWFFYHKFPRCSLGWLLSNLVSTHSIGKHSLLVVAMYCLSVEHQWYSLRPSDSESFSWTLVKGLLWEMP